jgi:hypothetical protein
MRFPTPVRSALRNRWFRRISWTVIAVLVGIAIGYLVRGSSEDTKVISIQYQDVPPEEASEIAAAFRPVLLFDSGEHWRPLEVSRFLSEQFDEGSHHQFCEAPTQEQAAPDCSDIGGLQDLIAGIRRAALEGRRSYLDLHGRGATGADYRGSHRSTCPDDGVLRDCDRGSGSAIYYRVTKANDRWYADYWWFLRYNEFTRFPSFTSCSPFKKLCDNHEGDWEGVTVVTKVDSKDEFEYVSFAQHKGRFRYGRQQVKHLDEHPVVFVARGSHASYPARCLANCLQSIKVGPAYLPEEPADGDKPWRRNSVSACGDVQDRKRSCLRPPPVVASSSPEPSNAWPGHWGAGCDQQRCQAKGPDSPASPGTQPRYRDPSCFGVGNHIGCDGPANIDLAKRRPELTAKADCDPWFGARIALCPATRSRWRRISPALERVPQSS